MVAKLFVGSSNPLYKRLILPNNAYFQGNAPKAFP